MSCASSCPTQDHSSYGACLRSKSLAITGLESTSPSFTREASKKWDSDLDAYAAAIKQGIQPESTKRSDVDAAVEASQIVQQPFRAGETQVAVTDG